ncbi:MAG: hypothetical protein WA285_24340, partial [Mycobacterium sp.]
ISPEKDLVGKGFEIINSTCVEEVSVLDFSLSKPSDAATLGQKRPLAKSYSSSRPTLPCDAPILTFVPVAGRRAAR